MILLLLLTLYTLCCFLILGMNLLIIIPLLLIVEFGISFLLSLIKAFSFNFLFNRGFTKLTLFDSFFFFLLKTISVPRKSPSCLGFIIFNLRKVDDLIMLFFTLLLLLLVLSLGTISFVSFFPSKKIFPIDLDWFSIFCIVWLLSWFVLFLESLSFVVIYSSLL